jgi:hypothetical protein
LGTAILISIVLVVLIILVLVGFKWVKPDSLRLKVMELLGVRDAWPGGARAAQARHQTLVILVGG